MPSQSSSARTSLWTVIGVAIVAYASCDMVHEVLGHGLACALTGVRMVSLSTVALQTGSSPSALQPGASHYLAITTLADRARSPCVSLSR
jgi:hypothetical protein